MKPTSGPPATIGVGGPKPPPVSRVREVEGREERDEQVDNTNKSVRHSHTELRMLGQTENPPSKRARRPTRGSEDVDNSWEATRESNMICPITCG